MYLSDVTQTEKIDFVPINNSCGRPTSFLMKVGSSYVAFECKFLSNIFIYSSFSAENISSSFT